MNKPFRDFREKLDFLLGLRERAEKEGRPLPNGFPEIRNQTQLVERLGAKGVRISLSSLGNWAPKDANRPPTNPAGAVVHGIADTFGFGVERTGDDDYSGLEESWPSWWSSNPDRKQQRADRADAFQERYETALGWRQSTEGAETLELKFNPSPSASNHPEFITPVEDAPAGITKESVGDLRRFVLKLDQLYGSEVFKRDGPLALCKAIEALFCGAKFAEGGKTDSRMLTTVGNLTRKLMQLIEVIEALPSHETGDMLRLRDLVNAFRSRLPGPISSNSHLTKAPWSKDSVNALKAIIKDLEAALERAIDQEEDDLTVQHYEQASGHLAMVEAEVCDDNPALEVVNDEVKATEEAVAAVPASERHADVMSFVAGLAEVSRRASEDFIASREHGETFKEFSSAPEMVVIDPPEKTFQMGAPEEEEGSLDSERPVHEVTIGRKFALGRFTVTFEEYEAYCQAVGIDLPPDQHWGRGRRSVINVNWNDAQKYLVWLNGEIGLDEVTYRLSSEAEWEFACRAGTETRYSFGDQLTKEIANFGDPNKGRTVEVGSYPSNSWGLHDMHGNVYEWCTDRWHKNYEGAPADGSIWTKGGDERRHVLRGGSWGNAPENLRSAIRYRYNTGNRYVDFGFRVARTITI